MLFHRKIISCVSYPTSLTMTAIVLCPLHIYWHRFIVTVWDSNNKSGLIFFYILIQKGFPSNNGINFSGGSCCSFSLFFLVFYVIKIESLRQPSNDCRWLIIHCCRFKKTRHLLVKISFFLWWMVCNFILSKNANISLQKLFFHLIGIVILLSHCNLSLMIMN